MESQQAEESQTHVFLKPCGCLACAIVNRPERFKELAAAQRYAAKHGETYRLMPTQAVRDMAWTCPEHKRS